MSSLDTSNRSTIMSSADAMSGGSQHTCCRSWPFSLQNEFTFHKPVPTVGVEGVAWGGWTIARIDMDRPSAARSLLRSAFLQFLQVV